jgi:hypothetical protein
MVINSNPNRATFGAEVPPLLSESSQKIMSALLEDVLFQAHFQIGAHGESVRRAAHALVDRALDAFEIPKGMKEETPSLDDMIAAAQISLTEAVDEEAAG